MMREVQRHNSGSGDGDAATVYALVAVDQAVDAALTYHIPELLAEITVVGARVVVPLGRGDKPVAGTVLAVGPSPEFVGRGPFPPTVAPGGGADQQGGLPWAMESRPFSRPIRIKNILTVHVDIPQVPADLLALAEWISRYYFAPVGLVLSAIVPAGVKKNARLPRQRLVVAGSWPLTRDNTQDQSTQTTPVVPQKKRILQRDRDLLNRLVPWLAEEPRTESQVQEFGAISRVTLKRLVKRGLLAIQQRLLLPSGGGSSDGGGGDDWNSSTMRAPEAATSGVTPTPPLELVLTAEQEAVLANLQPLLEKPAFAVRLIQGVTGCGKTEVYLRAAEQVVAAGRRVIVLVPEIALTPQTVERFTRRFDRVAIMHSGLSDSQRHQHWRAVASGWAQVIVGVRSAIFAPAENLGLIVVDEEHESSYKQDSTPRYHGRDVAVRRGQMLNIPVLLGSATPCLESWHNAQSNRHYSLLQMTSRPSGVSMPRVLRVDMKAQRHERPGLHILSTVLEHALGEVLRDKGQAILLLNRRGYAHYVACARCEWVMLCDNCDATMVVHRLEGSQSTVSREQSVVRCHYCLTSRLLPKICPQCHAKVVALGQGTQRAEDEVRRKFPHARILRMDSDTMRQGRDYERVLQEFAAGAVDILLGTQMIAKGLDFPNVRLVGVLNADLAMTSPDFRAAERTFDLICQVAGRSGRAQQQGLVVVQTFQPDEPAMVFAANHDYAGFVADELPHRQALGYPPFGRIVRMVVSDKDHELVRGQARWLVDRIAAAQTRLHLTETVRLEGPQPPPMGRLAEKFRWEILLFSATAGPLQQILAELREQRVTARLKVDLLVDVDPLQMQ